MWILGYDYNHSSVKKVRSVWPTSWQKRLTSLEWSTHVYQSTRCWHNLLLHHYLSIQSGGQKYPGGSPSSICFFLCLNQIKMVSAQLPKNSEPQNKQQKIRKLKQRSYKGTKGTFFFFCFVFHFERLYLLNSPPGGAVDLIIGAEKTWTKTNNEQESISVISMCLQSARSTSERGSCPAGTPSDERPRWPTSCDPSGWGSRRPWSLLWTCMRAAGQGEEGAECSHFNTLRVK